MSLNPRQRERLWKAVRETFSKRRLEELLDFRLDKRLEDISLGDDYQEVVFDLIQAARQEGWLDRLLLEVRQARPDNADLFALAQGAGLASTDLERSGLEAIVHQHNSFLDIARWRSKLGEIEARVCRVELLTSGGTMTGTGWLVAPDVVLTNYHVMAPAILGQTGDAPPGTTTVGREDVRFRFDYKVLPDGRVLHDGTSFGLAEGGWLVDSSPYSQADIHGGEPGSDELDYALVRLDESAAEGYVGGGEAADRDAPTRGFIEMPAVEGSHVAESLGTGQALFIVQHPEGRPLQLAFDTDSVIGLNPGSTRVRYRTNTLKGSSGSPCFDVNWRPVALHHFGDPRYEKLHRPGEFNQGIPLPTIRALVESRGHGDAFGSPTQ